MLSDNFNQTLFQFIGQMNVLSYNLSKDHKPENITALEYNLLEYLYLNDGIALKKISAYFDINPRRISRTLKKLVEKAYVIKVKDASDKRQVNCYLTKKGKLILDECFFQFIKDINQKYDHISDQEQNYLSESMTYILKKLQIEQQM